MNSSAVQYVGFIVAALILSWAVIEINRRYFRRRKVDVRSLNTWVPLDTAQPDATEDIVPDSDTGAEPGESSEQNLHARARQNGHYSESKKSL